LVAGPARLPAAWHLATVLLRALAWSALAWLGAALLWPSGEPPGALAQLRLFAGGVLAPLAAAGCIARAFGTGLRREDARWLLRANAPAPRLAAWARARAGATRGRLDHPLAKFVLFPLLPALPAFRLHQHIAFGGTFGEYYTYGLKAYLLGFGLWWAAWAIGLAVFAAALRVAIEAAALLGAALQPRRADALRALLEGAGHALFYLGAPAWLLLRALGG
jgi:apolipoprotein N-acyltransferase